MFLTKCKIKFFIVVKFCPVVELGFGTKGL